MKKVFFCMQDMSHPEDPFHAALPSLEERDRWLGKIKGDFNYRTHQKILTFDELDLILEGEGTQEIWDLAKGT